MYVVNNDHDAHSTALGLGHTVTHYHMCSISESESCSVVVCLGPCYSRTDCLRSILHWLKVGKGDGQGLLDRYSVRGRSKSKNSGANSTEITY